MPVTQLAEARKKRIAAGGYYKLVQAFINYSLNEYKTGTVTIPLKAEAFESWIKQREKDLETPHIEDLDFKAPFKTTNHSMDAKLMQKSEFARLLNEGWFENLEEDSGLSEAYLIICDLINLLKTPN